MIKPYKFLQHCLDYKTSPQVLSSLIPKTILRAPYGHLYVNLIGEKTESQNFCDLFEVML